MTDKMTKKNIIIINTTLKLLNIIYIDKFGS